MGEGTCQLLHGAAQVCEGSLLAVAAVISTVADVVGCDWHSHRGEGKPEAEDFGDRPCCKCGSVFRYMQKAAVWVASLFSMM